MYSARSFRLTTQEFNYLKSALGSKVNQYGDKAFFTAEDVDELADMLNRLKGLYDKYDELKSMVVYHCFVLGSLNPFRELMRMENVGSNA
jgi:hypothetical protein